ncbi:MAG TPA: cytochrome c [Anaerolineae bacterium]|jgi:mono/diheme cytochrome c family protein
MMPFRILAVFLLWVALAACDSLKPPPTPVLSPVEIRGRSVFETYCARCHGTSGETVIVGPALAGIASRGGSRLEGMAAPAYIRDSILNPNAYIVEGFPEGIMPLDMKDQMSPDDLDAVMAYLLTLK